MQRIRFMSFLETWQENTGKGVLATFIVSFGILFIFFAPILKNPNDYYFASSGDGMQTYFQALYHTIYDTTLLRQQSINYPYGESVFFTGCMPSITNTVKLLKPVVDLSSYTVGIINFLMLISIPLSAIFIFLILRQLKLRVAYSVLAATGIAFLSPQIDRLGGHFALTFQFAVPAFIYFLATFYQSPSYHKSLLIGLFVFFISSQHLYFFGFSGLIGFVFFTILFLKKDFPAKKSLLVVHFLIQIIFPYILLQLLLQFSNSAPDRTSFPWGFIEYRANTSSVFYPSGQWYETWASTFITPIHYDWEGESFVGLTGILATITMIVLFIRNLFRKKIQVSGNVFLDILLLVSVLALFCSFGFPFIYAEDMLKYAGPIKQMRGIGRFAWVFFYIINIAGFYFIYQWTKNMKPLLKTILHIFAFSWLCTEAYPALKIIQPIVANKLPDMEDSQNKLPQNQWINKLYKEEFQAILPLPYFHIGSENITIGSHSDLSNYTYIVSLKTGLPLYAVSASRTSLTETYRNAALIIDHSSPPELPPLVPGKAFLVICKKEELNAEEKLLYEKSTLLFRNGPYEILKFYPESLAAIYQEKKKLLLQEITGHNTPADTLSSFLLTFEQYKQRRTFRGFGALQFKAGDPTVIYDSILPVTDSSKKFIFSFWMADFQKDLYPRTYIEMQFMDSTGKEYYKHLTNALWYYKQFDKDWALIEFPIHTAGYNDRLKITLYNNYLRPSKLISIDNFLIKTQNSHIYHSDSKYISKDNRYYVK